MSEKKQWFASLGVAAAALSLLTAPCASWSATPAHKQLTIEADQAFTGLNIWAQQVNNAARPLSQEFVTALPLPQSQSAAKQRYTPAPVILGTPDLPLVGANIQDLKTRWASSLNYQGMQVRLIVRSATGAQDELRSLAQGVRAGERFRLQVVTTFDAQIDFDSVQGSDFALERGARVYPEADRMARIDAGRVTQFPADGKSYFQFSGQAATDRIVMTVRHANAQDKARSSQPAYRQDTAAGASNYLQLVPAGQYAAFEQLLAPRQDDSRKE